MADEDCIHNENVIEYGTREEGWKHKKSCSKCGELRIVEYWQ